MKVVTFAIQKGGTGKTSMAVSTAVNLAEKSKRVLFIDADPQGNSTAWMISDTAIAHDLADVLFKKCTAKSAIVATPKRDGIPAFPDALSLIPTASLGSTLRLYSSTTANQSPYAIRQLLKTVRDDFDYAVIDTSPAFGPLEQSCLLASDEVVAVLNIDEFSHDGLITFIDSLVDMRDRYDTEKPILARLVLNSRNKSQKMQDDYIARMTSAASAQGQIVYIVPIDQAFKKAQSVHIPVQSMFGVKKETVEVVDALACDIAGIVNEVQEVAA